MSNNKDKFEKMLEIAGKTKELIKDIPSTDVVSVFKNFLEAYKENAQTVREIAKMEQSKEILVRDMTLKYDLYYRVFTQIFLERSEAINKSFSIIDKGIETDDKEMISIGLNALSKIVAASPFSNLSELAMLLKSDQVIEI